MGSPTQSLNASVQFCLLEIIVSELQSVLGIDVGKCILLICKLVKIDERCDRNNGLRSCDERR